MTGRAFDPSASFTRPNNATAYTAGDVVGAAAAALQFAAAPARVGGVLQVVRVELEIDVNAIPSGMTTFTLHLYNVTPPSALADNAAWDLASGDRASYLGYVDLIAPADKGSTLYVSRPADVQIKAASANIFGYLVTDAGYTPGAQDVYKVTLHTRVL